MKKFRARPREAAEATVVPEAELSDLVALRLVNIDGARKDFWRAIGHEGDTLENFFTKNRDKT